MRNDIPEESLDAIAALGFDVYQSSDPRWRSYAYYTDGKRIAYIQNDRLEGLCLSTVHIANRTTGTGFGLRGEPFEFSREGLEKGFQIPAWANSFDRASVRKYDDVAHFLRCSLSKLELVREGAK